MAKQPHLNPTTYRGIVVMKQYPDTEAWLCGWLAWKHCTLTKQHEEVRVLFTPAGISLSPDELRQFRRDGWEVMQTHNFVDESGEKSPLELMIQDLGYEGNPLLKPFIDMARGARNNILDPTNVHFLLKMLPEKFLGDRPHEVEWDSVWHMAFQMFDMLYRYHQRELERAERFRISGCQLVLLPGGIRLCAINSPRHSDVAFDGGADVVVWKYTVPNVGNHIGIQVSRDNQTNLVRVVRMLREAECLAQAYETKDDPEQIGLVVCGNTPWFLHNDRRFVSSGSRAHPLVAEQITRLSWESIVNIVSLALFEEGTEDGSAGMTEAA